MRYNTGGASSAVVEILVHTGQHYDYNMSKVFFEELRIPQPHYNLGVGSGKHGEMTGSMLARIEEVLLGEHPDLVLVYGDTNSTLAGALAAAKLHIPVAHVEAGLRSFNRSMPEEINRVVADHLSLILLCPTDRAVFNLRAEGIDNRHFDPTLSPFREFHKSPKTTSVRQRLVALVGDVMYDVFLYNRAEAAKTIGVLEANSLKSKSYALATVHREDNTRELRRLRSIFSALSDIASEQCPIILPLHPRTRKALEAANLKFSDSSRLRIIPPVGYLEMLVLELNARVILTDSGGIQKEAYFARVPCVTLRDETEWVETVDAGWNVLAGSERDRIVHCFNVARPGTPKDLYGDGRAATKIVSLLTTYFHE